MGAVRSRGNRTTEVRLRMGLVRAGISGWAGHPIEIPGKPDFYFQIARLAVFVDGCFWHGCAKCGHIPKTNQAFWAAKIARNQQRHQEVGKMLARQKIKVLRFWEHELKEDLQSCVSSISKTRDREMRLAAARASLQESWRLAEAAGLDSISDEAIDREIAAVRRARSYRSK
jgi:DNA mismatch endonuclease (patch repair protein)